MLEILTRNYNYRNQNVRLYEVGRIYLPGGEDGLAVENKVLSMGAYGSDMDFYALKGCVEAILKDLRAEDVHFEVPSVPNPSYHPRPGGRCVRRRPAHRQCWARSTPWVAQNYGVDAQFYCAELELNALMAAKGADPEYVPLPKFPNLTRDIAVVCDEAVTVGALEACIRKGAKGLLKECKLFDIYRGKGRGRGQEVRGLQPDPPLRRPLPHSEEADEDVKSILATWRKSWAQCCANFPET